MKFKLSSLLLVAVLSTACTPPASLQTPQGKTAYTADQIVVRVNELMNAAIAANASKDATGAPALADNVTRIIVTFCVSTDMTLANTPQGWQVTVATAWSAAKTQIALAGVTNTSIIAAMGAVDTVLAAFGS